LWISSHLVMQTGFHRIRGPLLTTSMLYSRAPSSADIMRHCNGRHSLPSPGVSVRALSGEAGPAHSRHPLVGHKFNAGFGGQAYQAFGLPVPVASWFTRGERTVRFLLRDAIGMARYRITRQPLAQIALAIFRESCISMRGGSRRELTHLPPTGSSGLPWRWHLRPQVHAVRGPSS
jgi:hypothetical protein